MTERNKFECDVTGELFGAKNDVLEIEIRRHRAGSPFEVSKETVHVSMKVLGEEIGQASWPRRLRYLGVERGEDGEEIVGMCSGFRSGLDSDVHYKYEERNSVVISQYEPFFEFVEQTILY